MSAEDWVTSRFSPTTLPLNFSEDEGQGRVETNGFDDPS